MYVSLYNRVNIRRHSQSLLVVRRPVVVSRQADWSLVGTKPLGSPIRCTGDSSTLWLLSQVYAGNLLEVSLQKESLRFFLFFPEIIIRVTPMVFLTKLNVYVNNCNTINIYT